MSDSRVENVLRDQGQMEGDRGNWESHWQEAAERVLPRQRDFNQMKRAGGEKLSEKVFDSTAPMALEKFAAVMEGMLAPRTQRWHELTVSDENLKNDPDVKAYLYDVTSALFRARYAATANFAGQANENFMGLGAFGTGGVFVDDHVGRGLRYKATALAELFIAENFQGAVDKVHRRFEMTARQWRQKFGDECPPAILKAADKEPERKFELIHCVKPREDAHWSRMDYRGMPFASYYVAYEGRKLMREGGYRAMRYAISRYVTGPRETYGRSPAMTVLADIKTANEQQKTLLKTGQLVAQPPLLLSDDGALGPFKMTPNGLNYGALGPSGEELAKPMQIGANMPITLEMQQDTRGVIKEGFLVDLFRVLIENPSMTATQAMLVAQQQGMFLGPAMGRQQSEFLGPLITAEIDILAQANALPEMPPQLAEAGDVVKIEYTSPLALAQRAGEGVAISGMIEDAVAIQQFDPSAVKVVKWSDAFRTMAEVRGVKPDLLRTPDEMAQIEEGDAQALQAQEALAAAGQAGKAAKDFAGAQALAGTTGLAPDVLGAAA